MTPFEREALARNDRFLREFVEAFELCPYARFCRESERLYRRVIPGERLTVEPVQQALAELTSPAFEHIEVGLLIFPAVSASFAEFERFAAALRDLPQPGDKGFFLVPFHPDAPEDTSTPARLVSFLRRSPDPTLQLVRISVLQRVRSRGSGETVWMDPATLATRPLPAPAPPSVSERIAQHGYETVHRVGVDRLRMMLKDLKR